MRLYHFEAVYCSICGRRSVAVARYRMICFVLYPFRSVVTFFMLLVQRKNSQRIGFSANRWVSGVTDASQSSGFWELCLQYCRLRLTSPVHPSPCTSALVSRCPVTVYFRVFGKSLVLVISVSPMSLLALVVCQPTPPITPIVSSLLYNTNKILLLNLKYHFKAAGINNAYHKRVSVIGSSLVILFNQTLAS